MIQPLIDTFGRVHTYLRLSVTDKCNLHCVYCNPATSPYRAKQQAHLLSDHELLRLVHVFTGHLGITKIRLTGGEPFVRPDFRWLIKRLTDMRMHNPFSIGITTNGTLLAESLPMLKEYGVDSLNISLDSLTPNGFASITGSNTLFPVYDSILRAHSMNFTEVKVNVVVIRGVNDHELLDFTEFAIRNDLHVRFIEFMPFTSNGWNRDHYMPAGTMKEIIGQRYSLYPLPPEDHSVSKDFIIEGHCGKISFITSVSEHFCDGCNRVRITAEGKLKPCLFSPPENDLDLRSVLRSETVTDEQVEAMIRTCILKKWKQHPEMEELSGNLAHEMIGIGG